MRHFATTFFLTSVLSEGAVATVRHMTLEPVLYSNVFGTSSLIGEKLPRSVVLKTLTTCVILFSKLDGPLPTLILDLLTLMDRFHSKASLAKTAASRSAAYYRASVVLTSSEGNASPLQFLKLLDHHSRVAVPIISLHRTITLLQTEMLR